jgi:hypothetical protein
MESEVWPDLLVKFAILFGVPASFVTAAWLTRRRYGRAGVAILWAASSLIFGYLMYRRICSHGSCDVGGRSSYFLSGTPHWFLYMVPRFALVGGIGFGAGVFVLSKARVMAPGRSFWPRPLVGATCAVIAGGFLAFVAVNMLP